MNDVHYLTFLREAHQQCLTQMSHMQEALWDYGMSENGWTTRRTSEHMSTIHTCWTGCVWPLHSNSKSYKRRACSEQLLGHTFYLFEHRTCANSWIIGYFKLYKCHVKVLCHSWSCQAATIGLWIEIYRELRFLKTAKEPEVQEYLGSHSCTCEFNPPHALDI